MTRGRTALGRYLAAETISLAGTQLSLLALPWFVLVTTGSAARTGLIAACEMAPYVVAQTLGGPLIDRVGARRISVVSDAASAVVVAAIPLLHAWGRLDFALLVILVALAGAVRGPGDSAKSALVPAVVALSGARIERVTGLLGAAERFATTLGPATAGLVIAWRGPLAALVIDALSFAIGAALVASIRAERTARDASEESSRYRTQLREGFAFVRRDPLLRAIVGVIATTNLLDAAMFSVLLPVWAHDRGHGPAVIGVIASAFSITALGGSLLAAAAGHRLPRRTVFLFGYLLAGAPRFFTLALGAPVGAVVAIHLAAGFGAGFLNPITQAITLERIPPALLGRATSLIDALAWSGIPLGGVSAGVLVGAVGLAPAFALCGAIYLAVTTLPALRPAFRAMNQPVSVAGAGTAGAGSAAAACSTATSSTASALPNTAPPMR